MNTTMSSSSTNTNQLLLPMVAAIGWFVLSTVFVATQVLSPVWVSIG